jgi:hypothetical protein
MKRRWADLHLDLDSGIYTGRVDGRLTRTERRLVQYLAERIGQGVPLEQLEVDVWDHAPGSRSKTAPVTLRRLRSKLGIVQRDADNRWRLIRCSGPLPTLPHPTVCIADAIASIRAAFAAGWSTVVLWGPPKSGRTHLAAGFAATEPVVTWVEQPTADETWPDEGLLVVDGATPLPTNLPPTIRVLVTAGCPHPGTYSLPMQPWSAATAQRLGSSDAVRWPGVVLAGSVAGWLPDPVPPLLARLAVAGRVEVGRLGGSVERLVEQGWVVEHPDGVDVAPGVRHALANHPSLVTALDTWNLQLLAELETLFAVFDTQPLVVRAALRSHGGQFLEMLDNAPREAVLRAAYILSWITAATGVLKQALTHSVQQLFHRFPSDPRVQLLRSRVLLEPLPPRTDLGPEWLAFRERTARIVLFDRPLQPYMPLADTVQGFERAMLEGLAFLEATTPESILRGRLVWWKANPGRLVTGVNLDRCAAVRLDELDAPLAGLPLLEHALAIARAHQLDGETCYILDQAATMTFDLAPARAAVLWRESAEAAVAANNPQSQLNALLCQVMALLYEGEFHAAHAQLQTAFALGLTMTPHEKVGAFALRAVTLLELGDRDAAASCWALARTDSTDVNVRELVDRTDATVAGTAPGPEPARVAPLVTRVIHHCHHRSFHED